MSLVRGWECIGHCTKVGTFTFKWVSKKKDWLRWPQICRRELEMGAYCPTIIFLLSLFAKYTGWLIVCIIDIIRNKGTGHNFKGFFRCSIRRLCNPQARTMTKSEKSSLVFLKISFTIRERLMPEMACSTLTRTCAILRLRSFSFAVNSFLRGFFSADTIYELWVHTLESLHPCAKRFALDKKCSPGLPCSYRGFCLDRSG